MSVFTRRRVLTILAAAAGLPLALKAGSAEARLVRWEGHALGATASLALYHHDEDKARRAIDAAIAELQRLESVFSLYRADSAMARLNRDGRLDAAPAELMVVVGEALAMAERTDGWFDPTVQPLWQAYLHHEGAAPAPDAIAAARALVDWRGIIVEGESIRFGRAGMGMTLNGIAQGWITDRVAEVLRTHGLERMLVDMGEPKAMAAKPDGSAWRIGIADPRDPARTITAVDVVDRAVATSGGYGTIFDSAGRFTHLMNPKTGGTAPAEASVTVIAAKASTADALSTALAVAPAASRQAILSAIGDATALVAGPDGAIVTLTA